jgi:hypothetical protein
MKRKAFKEKRIAITEQLTANHAQLLKKASELVMARRLQAAWSHDEKILIKLLDNRVVLISAVSDLVQYNIG